MLNIKELEQKFQLWKNASLAYYNTPEPIISDEEFDKLQDILLSHGTKEIIDFIKNHIVRDWGFEDISKLPETESKDEGTQISLKKIKWVDVHNSLPEVMKFFNYHKHFQYYIAPKFDGCSVRIDMTNNNILTRGGLNITEKLQNNSSIIDAKKKYEKCKFIVGEIVINKQLFEKKYSSEFANPRNFVSGAINSKEPNQNILQDLTFIPCTDGINPLVDNKYNKQIELSHRYFTVFDIEKYYTHLKSDLFPFLCDGVVISTIVKERKIKDNYPLNMVAVKFKSAEAESTVIDFEWTQKKSQRLTPIVKIEPTLLEGSMISQCSGYNYQYLLDNGIGIGSRVVFTKSGDIIPVIIETLTKSTDIKMPDIPCKHVGKHLIVDTEFDTSLVTKFRNAFKKLDIKHIGDVTCSLIGEVCNYNIVEMFNPRLKIEFLSKLGSTSANYRNFKKIYEIKTMFLSDLIYILQFDNVGEVLAKRLADIMVKRSTDVSGISKEVLLTVAKGEGFAKIQNSINILKSYGLNIILEPLPSTDSISIEMTGEPGNMTKEQYLKMVQQINPNVIHLPLTKNSNYLITNDLSSNTTKMNKARKYNVKIMTYNDFLTFIKTI